MKNTQHSGGYIALLAILIVGAAALAIATSLLTSGVDSQRTTLVTQSSTAARNLATSCGEEALQQVHDSTSYVGTANLTLSTGSCSYTVTNTGSTTRTIDTSSTVNNNTRRAKIYVTIGSSSISVTSWQEVG